MWSRDAVVGSNVEVIRLFLLEVQMESTRDDNLGTTSVTVNQNNIERYWSNARLVHRVSADPLCTHNHAQYQRWCCHPTYPIGFEAELKGDAAVGLRKIYIALARFI